MGRTSIRELSRITGVPNIMINSLINDTPCLEAVRIHVGKMRDSHRCPLLTNEEVMRVLEAARGSEWASRWNSRFPPDGQKELIGTDEGECRPARQDSPAYTKGTGDEMERFELRLKALESHIAEREQQASVQRPQQIRDEINRIVLCYSKREDVPPAGLYSMLYDKYFQATAARILITDGKVSMLGYIERYGDISMLLACAVTLFSETTNTGSKS